MYEALGRFVVRHRRSTLLLALGLAAIAASLGFSSFDRFTYGGELQRDAESLRAAEEVRTHLPQGGADVLVIYRSTRQTIDDPGFRAEVESSLHDLPAGLVIHAVTYWNSDALMFASGDRRATVAGLTLTGANETERTKNYQRVRAALRTEALSVAYTGPIAVREAMVTATREDMARTEMLAFPLIFLVLLLVFRSLVAALLPVATGGLILAVTLGLMRPLTEFMDISVLAVNSVAVLALAVAVDAALFVVSRFREELARQPTVDEAVVVTVATAGRTGVFSCLTIAVVILGLTFIPIGLTRSIGVCAALAMLVGAVVCVTLLPAVLAVLGHRVDLVRFRLPSPLRRPGAGDRFWGKVGRAVLAEPVGYLIAAVVTLAILTTPFLHTTLGYPDQRSLPAQNPARLATEQLRDDFALPAADLVQVVTRFGEPVDTPDGKVAVGQWTRQLTTIPGARIAVTAAAAGHHAVQYVYSGTAESATALDTVRRIRALPPPAGGEVLVSGAAAMALDGYELLRDRLPVVLLFIAVTAFLMLAALLKSVLLPLKALVVSALSLGASFGALTWIFQDGHLVWLVGATKTGYLDVLQPIILLVALIGFSMDYEFFLLSRIREHYTETGDNNASIVAGLQRSGPVFTGAAVVVLVVVAVFASSDIVFIKQFCVGLFIGVLVDATLVRAVLVPSSMRLLGRANWWWPVKTARTEPR